jgi:glycerol-3-phosphate acyltransferase PlsY
MGIEVAVLGICLGAYLLGSIPFGLVIARLRRVDLRSVGSGNIGATNAARALGKGWGVLVLLLDAGKAVLPVAACQHYLPRVPLLAPLATPNGGWLAAAAGASAFLGHLYPIWAGFQGGKGVATAFGCFIALEPRAALVSFAIYAVAYGVTRISSVGSLLSVLSFPAWLYLTGAGAPSYALAAGLLVFIVVRHRSNIQRLLARKEGRV